MDLDHHHLSSLLHFISTILALLLLVHHLLRKSKRDQKKREPPEAVGGWPIIGHLPPLQGLQPPHITLGNMANMFGPIFTIRMGIYKTLVVSNWEMAKEYFTTNDKVFDNRPKLVAQDILGYNYAMIRFSPYGSYWRQESDYLEATSLNGDECQKALRDFSDLTGIFVVSDAIPNLRWLDLGGVKTSCNLRPQISSTGHVRAMKKTAKVLDQLIQGWLEEHKLKRSNSEEQEAKQDFVDVMLSILDSTDLETASYDANTINKATSMALILAGTDTTTVTLTWALALLLNNRAAPLSVPHESMEDCTVGGYHVSKGTRLLVNLSKLRRDPKIWSDPNEFRPERFLTTHKGVDVRGHELIPFGSGRRMCPGVSLALQFMQLTLAALLHGFDMATPSNEAVDMSGKFGLTNMKASPLDVLLTPRLPGNLYY
ncbi:hypothetical protein FEM48_Zijuj06G0074700 [Ziziphus jujuba var. spinosa]|uniref:Cytochrome P450 CYP82D47-like n=1 Tax=Ziziphus jujuba var. spinosa TaxID=714518 RepID=A0A978V7Z1_ZIZJJ|nr:hypothetical protein FEM48_Zijuj06G0074700 [Ziziphus jujuba var. spinosa]